MHWGVLQALMDRLVPGVEDVVQQTLKTCIAEPKSCPSQNMAPEKCSYECSARTPPSPPGLSMQARAGTIEEAATWHCAENMCEASH